MSSIGASTKVTLSPWLLFVHCHFFLLELYLKRLQAAL
ncbi:hypothetical protein H323_08315 [Vibrio parahaemolyticus VP766]|nr:hypothetical protein H323_08315 [Vibrio parahaemolyticus VP766]